MTFLPLSTFVERTYSFNKYAYTKTYTRLALSDDENDEQGKTRKSSRRKQQCIDIEKRTRILEKRREETKTTTYQEIEDDEAVYVVPKKKLRREKKQTQENDDDVEIGMDHEQEEGGDIDSDESLPRALSLYKKKRNTENNKESKK